MGVVIDEIEATVVPDTNHTGGGEGEQRPAEGGREESLIDQLQLLQERKARLVID